MNDTRIMLQERFKTVSAAVAAIHLDPSASHWLRNALAKAMERDPIDAARDADILAALLGWNADTALGTRRVNVPLGLGRSTESGIR